MIGQTIPIALGLWACAYLIGATPVSYLLARVLGGIDLRRHGSGNLGGSNLASQLGRRWLPLVVAVDLVRGGGPILIGQFLLELGEYPWLLVLTPLFTLLGNAWSPFLRFAGGRSVGVWAGGIVGISPSLFLAALIAYLCGWFASKRSAESLLAVMSMLPLVCLAWPESWFLVGHPVQFAAYGLIGGMLILAKRLVSNGGPLPADASRGSVILNRLLRDRDIADRQQWLARAPDRTTDL
jgi:glycerol-3-phosphate acyltransferase PlsY